MHTTFNIGNSSELMGSKSTCHSNCFTEMKHYESKSLIAVARKSGLQYI